RPNPNSPDASITGGGGLVKLSAAGGPSASFSPAPDQRGVDWIILGTPCTLYYTSAGVSIKRFDVCENRQLPDFCTGCRDGAGQATPGPLFGLRLLPDGGVLVADFNGRDGAGLVRRYDSSGAQVRTYVAINAYGQFFPWALVLDPDGTSFWVADNVTGEIFHFDLAGGPPVAFSRAGDCADFYEPCAVTGLAIVGEPAIAAPPLPASPTTITASITADSKVYDRTTVASITNCTLSNVQSG